MKLTAEQMLHNPDASQMLTELGYRSTNAEIRRFQRDSNKVFPSTLMISGKLDSETREALALAHASRVMFMAMRDDRSW